MKGYDNYKNIGVEWIGEIPEHWNKLKIGRSFDLIGSGTTPNTNVDKFYNEGKINWLNTGDLNDGYISETTKKITEVALKETSLRIFPEDSIVIALYGATIGKLGHLKIETTTNQACCVLSKSNKITNRFLFYFFLASRKNIISMSYGGGQPNISQELIKQLHLPAPSLDEQIIIASFLDYKTNLIDATIEKKKRLIELLKEKRQSVINEAATKGLNANAPMKDSGVEWLGEIPEHWEVKKLLHLSNIIDPQPDHRAPLMDEYGLPYLGIRDINKNGTINIETARIVELNAIEKQERAFTIKDGDIVFGKVGTLAEPKHILLGGERVALSATLVLIQTDEEITSRYLKYFLDSSFIWDQINTVIVGATRPALGIQQIRKFTIFFPPQNEVKQIVDYLDISTSRILDLIEKINHQIGNLQIYRQSLISEAVTGKIDVRDWQPPKK